ASRHGGSTGPTQLRDGGWRSAPARRSGSLLLAPALLGEHVTGAEDQETLAAPGDLGPAVLRVDDGVADGQVDRNELAAVLGAAAGTHGEDLALLGLFLGSVGNGEAAVRLLLGLGRPGDGPVLLLLQVHPCAFIRGGH